MPGVAAFFDVDGTLTRTDLVRDHVAFRWATRPRAAALGWSLALPWRVARMLALDAVDRAAMNRALFSWYRGFSPEELRRWVDERLVPRVGRRLWPEALPLLAMHARLGHAIVLLSGSLRQVVEPLAGHLRTALPGSPRVLVEAIDLEVIDGRFTGLPTGPPLAGREKARRALEVAEREGLDLARSHAYGDSMADVALLLTVGRPAAVHPGARLRALARRRGWPVLDLTARSSGHRGRP